MPGGGIINNNKSTVCHMKSVQKSQDTSIIFYSVSSGQYIFLKVEISEKNGYLRYLSTIDLKHLTLIDQNHLHALKVFAPYCVFISCATCLDFMDGFFLCEITCKYMALTYSAIPSSLQNKMTPKCRPKTSQGLQEAFIPSFSRVFVNTIFVQGIFESYIFPSVKKKERLHCNASSIVYLKENILPEKMLQRKFQVEYIC